MLDAGPAFQVVPPCMVHQNPPHQLRGNREEVCAILPAHALVVDEAQVSFIDQGGCLQGVAGTLPAHVVLGQTP